MKKYYEINNVFNMPRNYLLTGNTRKGVYAFYRCRVICGVKIPDELLYVITTARRLRKHGYDIYNGAEKRDMRKVLWVYFKPYYKGLGDNLWNPVIVSGVYNTMEKAIEAVQWEAMQCKE